jgi:hypothetical protein
MFDIWAADDPDGAVHCNRSLPPPHRDHRHPGQPSFLLKKIIPNPEPGFFGESGSGFRPRIFNVQKLQKNTAAKFLQFFSGIILWLSRKNIYFFKTFS